MDFDIKTYELISFISFVIMSLSAMILATYFISAVWGIKDFIVRKRKFNINGMKLFLKRIIICVVVLLPMSMLYELSETAMSKL